MFLRMLQGDYNQQLDVPHRQEKKSHIRAAGTEVSEKDKKTGDAKMTTRTGAADSDSEDQVSEVIRRWPEHARLLSVVTDLGYRFHTLGMTEQPGAMSDYARRFPLRRILFLPTAEIDAEYLMANYPDYRMSLLEVRQSQGILSKDELLALLPDALLKGDTERLLQDQAADVALVTDIMLVSYVRNGYTSVVRLGFLKDGRPVALKSAQPPAQLHPREYKSYLLGEILGIAPKIHGLWKDSDGSINIVMDIVPGEFTDRAKVQEGTFRDLVQINDRLINAGMSVSLGFQYLVTAEGRVLVIDLLDSIWDPMAPENNWINYSGEMHRLMSRFAEIVENLPEHEVQAQLRRIAQYDPKIFVALMKMYTSAAFERSLRAVQEEIRRSGDQQRGRNSRGISAMDFKDVPVEVIYRESELNTHLLEQLINQAAEKTSQEMGFAVRAIIMGSTRYLRYAGAMSHEARYVRFSGHNDVDVVLVHNFIRTRDKDVQVIFRAQLRNNLQSCRDCVFTKGKSGMLRIEIGRAKVDLKIIPVGINSVISVNDVVEITRRLLI